MWSSCGTWRERWGCHCATSWTGWTGRSREARIAHNPRLVTSVLVASPGAIVKTCGSRSLCCGVDGLAVGSFDELAGLETGAGADERDEVGCVDRPPAVLGGFDELERHRQPGGARTRALGDLGAVPDGREVWTRSLSGAARGLSWTSLTSIAGP